MRQLDVECGNVDADLRRRNAAGGWSALRLFSHSDPVDDHGTDERYAERILLI